MLSTDETEEFKSRYERLGVEPHVFEVSSSSYRNLSVDGADQTILVTGESGAGKVSSATMTLMLFAQSQFY